MFSQETANKALVACGRSCCICHKFCGTKMELHHIKQKAYGGEDSFENCIPLCFDCHSDMGKTDPNHPKGRGYSERELRMHRDVWYTKMADYFPSVEVCSADKKLFEKICSVFDESIREWLSKKDLRGTYPIDTFRPLKLLLYDSEDPFFEFLNFELEKLRGNLFESLQTFLDHLSEYTFPVYSTEGRNAPRIWLLEHYLMYPEEDYEEYRNKYYAQFSEEGNRLNDLASNAWSCYCDFVRQGRRIIAEYSQRPKSAE